MKKTFIDGIALGVFLTLLVLFLLAIFFDEQLFGSSSDSYIQTILTSTAAIGAAYLALSGIRNQIQQNFEIEKSRRLRRLRASRASLPLALSDIVSAAEKLVENILFGTAGGSEEIVKSLSHPAVLETLSRCIEFSDQISSDRLSQILRYVQLAIARFDIDHFSCVYPPYETDWVKVGHSRTSYIIDLAVLAAICNSAFPFARGSEPKIPEYIDIGKVHNALFSFHILLDEYPRLEELIEERWQAGEMERDFSRP